MSTASSWKSPPATRGGWGVWALVAGVLAVGGATGLVLNRTSAPRPDLAAAPREAILAAETEAPVASSAALQVAVQPAVAVPASASSGIHFSEAAPPPDPFQPEPGEAKHVAAPHPVSATAAAAASGLRAGKPAGAPVEKPVKSPVTAPKAADITITGVIQGDPPLVVVRYEGRSLFLKIGDQVADSWRLEAIKERSAVFQLGEQRVEVPIQGGSSQ
jgi:hypothetical protein